MGLLVMSVKTITKQVSTQEQPTSSSRRHLLAKAIVAVPVISSLLATSEANAAVPGKKGTSRHLHTIQRITMGVTPALLSEVKAIGVDAQATEDGMIIKGRCQLKGATVKSHGDHRIAMMLAVAACIACGRTKILQGEWVDVSFPGFYSYIT